MNLYVPQERLDLIDAAVTKKKGVKIQTYSDLYRLSLLHYNGGVYMDASSIAIENFDWLLKIGRFPSQFIFNRFETNPKVLLSIHPCEGGSGTW